MIKETRQGWFVNSLFLSMHYYHPRWLHLAEECGEGGAVKLLLHHRVLPALQDHPPLALLVKLLEACVVARVIEGGEGGA